MSVALTTTYENSYFRRSVLDALQKFLEQYGEGAIVTLVLLHTASKPMRWRSMGRPDRHRYVHSNELKTVERFMPMPFSEAVTSRLSTW